MITTQFPIFLDYGSYSIKLGYENKDIQFNHNQIVQNGLINDWENIENLYHYIFKQQSINMNNHPIIIFEPSINLAKQRIQNCELMFEKFNALRYYSTLKQKSSLYLNAQFTGIVLDVGYDLIQAVPIFENKTQIFNIRTSKLGGHQLDNYISNLIQTNNQSNIDLIKHHLTLTEQQNNKQNKVDTAAELLFNPQLNHINEHSLMETLLQSLKMTEEAIRPVMLKNVILVGGCSLIKGLKERVESQLKDEFKYEVVNVHTYNAHSSIFDALQGGRVLSVSLSNVDYIEKSEFQEYGEQILIKKCNFNKI